MWALFSLPDNLFRCYSLFVSCLLKLIAVEDRVEAPAMQITAAIDIVTRLSASSGRLLMRSFQPRVIKVAYAAGQRIQRLSGNCQVSQPENLVLGWTPLVELSGWSCARLLEQAREHCPCIERVMVRHQLRCTLKQGPRRSSSGPIFASMMRRLRQTWQPSKFPTLYRLSRTPVSFTCRRELLVTLSHGVIRNDGYDR